MRAPIEPIRACLRPRTTRHVRANRSRSRGKFLPADVACMACRIGEAHAVLVEVVGDREFAAKRVTPAVDVDLVDLVIAGLKQDRDVQPRFIDKLGDRDLVAEIRQANDQPVNRLTLLAKMPCIKAPVLARLHCPVLRRIQRKDAVADVEAIEVSDKFLARLERGRSIEELAAAHDQSELDGTKIAFAHCRKALRSARRRAEPRLSRAFPRHRFISDASDFSHLETFQPGCKALKAANRPRSKRENVGLGRHSPSISLPLDSGPETKPHISIINGITRNPWGETLRKLRGP